MFLYLMRHGEAIKAGAEIVNDADRPLTEYGRLQVSTIALELKRRNITASIISSPYARAFRTSEILAGALGSAPVIKNDHLASSGHAPPLEELLKDYRERQSLILVGHQPDIGMLVEQLLGFELGFSTAQLAAFESHEGPKWKYLWSLVPEDLLRK